jgi:hypothetical protein
VSSLLFSKQLKLLNWVFHSLFARTPCTIFSLCGILFCSEFDKEFFWWRAQDLGVAQTLVWRDGTREEDVQWIIQKSRNYIRKVVPEYFQEGMPGICKNTHEMCSIWAMQGECDSNAVYMLPNCAPVCGSCEALTIEGRCPIDANAFNVWGPGE